MTTVEFLEDRNAPHHRPHHIYKCVIRPKEVYCVAKENEHHESKNYKFLRSTPLKRDVPRYYGEVKDNKKNYFLLEDFNNGFSSPCIIDFKVGTRSWDVNASETRRNRLMEKCKKSTSESTGLRLVSETIRKNGVVTHNSTKSQNLKLTEQELMDRIQSFVQDSHKHNVLKYLKRMKRDLVKTRNQYPKMRIYSSSILITYDGDNLKQDPRIALIDFAHFHQDIDTAGGDFTNAECNDNIEKGIDTFIDYLKKEKVAKIEADAIYTKIKEEHSEQKQENE